MRIYFTRHGQTDWNKQDHILGRTDIPLNSTGLQQADELAEKIANTTASRPLGVIISSPMQRALDTAKSVGARVDCEIKVEPRFIEWDYGEFEGHGRDYNGFQAAKTEFGVRVGGNGESLFMLAHRVYSALDDIVKIYDCDVLIVAHGGVCRVMETYFRDMSVQEFKNYFMKNCELVFYDI